ncbi:MAG TPA: hypothetical protein VM532_10545, partial [Burkholderiales bacterium]|nr:hypothetical protein [Burkholderiales bacterium]
NRETILPTDPVALTWLAATTELVAEPESTEVDQEMSVNPARQDSDSEKRKPINVEEAKLFSIVAPMLGDPSFTNQDLETVKEIMTPGFENPEQALKQLGDKLKERAASKETPTGLTFAELQKQSELLRKEAWRQSTMDPKTELRPKQHEPRSLTLSATVDPESVSRSTQDTPSQLGVGKYKDPTGLTKPYTGKLYYIEKNALIVGPDVKRLRDDSKYAFPVETATCREYFSRINSIVTLTPSNNNKFTVELAPPVKKPTTGRTRS